MIEFEDRLAEYIWTWQLHRNLYTLFNYLAKVITGIKFKDGIEVTAIDQAAAWFRCWNTTFDNNSKKYVVTYFYLVLEAFNEPAHRQIALDRSINVAWYVKLVRIALEYEKIHRY